MTKNDYPGLLTPKVPKPKTETRFQYRKSGRRTALTADREIVGERFVKQI